MFVMLSIVLVLFVYFGGSMVPKELLKNKELLLGFVVGLVMCSLFKDRLIEGFECINNMQSDRPDVYAFRDIDTSTQGKLDNVCTRYLGEINEVQEVCEKGGADGGVMELCAEACRNRYQNLGPFVRDDQGGYVRNQETGKRMRDSPTAPCNWSPERLNCVEAGNTWSNGNCQTGGSVSMEITQEFADSLNAGDDCWITPEEAADAGGVTQALFNSVRQNIANQFNPPIDPENVELEGVSTVGLPEPGCG